MNAETVKMVTEAALMADEAARKLIEVDVRMEDFRRALPDVFPAKDVAVVHALIEPIVRDLYKVSKRVERAVVPVAALIPKEKNE